MSERLDNINRYNETDLIRMAQYTRIDSLSKEELSVLVERLANLDYEIVWGCCGINTVRRLYKK